MKKTDDINFDGVSVIENAGVRLGINLGLGGAVTWLSEQGGPNLINSADWGRQVQMSFYSGPVPFRPAGVGIRESWAYLGWNPIQSGDCFGNRSRVLAHENTGDSIYVKSVPMHWPLDNHPGECTFETRYEIKANTVIVNARINNNRPDRTQYPARSQELPAVYTNGGWYKLVSYTGCEPFTGGPVSTLVDLDDGRGWPWISYCASENWAALLDKSDYGLGVYNPGTCRFIGGFSGEKGKGGPKDWPTGYISPVSTEVLDYNIVYEYNYVLIVGTLEQIRREVYALSEKGSARRFEFDGTRSHWSYRNISDGGFPVKGCLKFDFGAGGALVSPSFFIKSGGLRGIEIDAEFRSAGKIPAKLELDLYDGTENKTGSRSLPFETEGDGVRRKLFIPAETGAHCVTGMAVLFGSEGSAEIYSVEIK